MSRESIRGQLMSAAEVAEFLGVHYRTVHGWIVDHPDFPESIRLSPGGRHLFVRAEIEEFAKQRIGRRHRNQ